MPIEEITNGESGSSVRSKLNSVISATNSAPTEVRPIAYGGTGSTTASAARVALGVDEVVPAVAQVVEVYVGGSVTTSWIAEYFDIDAVAQVYRFWFTVDGSGGSPPSPPPGGTAVQVNLTDGTAPDAVVAAIVSAMATYPSEISTSDVGSFAFKVTNVIAGPATAPASYATSISVNLTTNGASATTQLLIADASITSNKLETPGLTINTTYVPLGGSVTLPGETADQIRDKLITLTGVSRLPASAVKDIPSGGTKTIAVFTPRDNQPPATVFATLDTRNSIAILDFDDTTDESGIFVSIIPEASVLTSGLKIRIHWTAATATSGACVWEVCLERLTTDIDTDSFDVAARVTTTTNATSGVPNVSEITLTTIDSVTAGDSYRLKVTRDANNVSDTMSGDAELLTVEVRTAN